MSDFNMEVEQGFIETSWIHIASAPLK